MWGDELDCVGDWGQKWEGEEECPDCGTKVVGTKAVVFNYGECSDKCKTGGDCNYHINGDDKNCKAEDYNLGRCQTLGDEGLAGGALALVVILVVLCICLIVYVAYRAFSYCGFYVHKEGPFYQVKRRVGKYKTDANATTGVEWRQLRVVYR
jgi:hypothetical protein